MKVDDKEIEAIIECIKMAAAEDFYLFYRENIKNGEETVANLLRKFGVDEEKVSKIMDGWC